MASMVWCARCDRPASCWVRFSSRTTRRVLAFHPLCDVHARTERGLQATGCSMATAVFEPLSEQTVNG